MRTFATYLIMLAALALFASCNGGGRGRTFPPGTLPESSAIQSLNVSPSTVTTGTAVQITASYTNPPFFEGKTKTWEASGDTITVSAPDFDLVLRGTAGIKSASATLDTTSSTIYWFTPSSPGTYTISLRIGNAFLSRQVVVASAPIFLEVEPGSNDTTIVRIMARDINDLYQGAFRIIFNSEHFRPTNVVAGSFLGASSDILFLGLTNQSGFVPIGITRKGAVPGVSGSGEIAEAVFVNKSTSHAPSSLAVAGFELGTYLIRDSSGTPIFGN